MSDKEYIIQITIYKNGELIKSTTVVEVTEYENNHKLSEVIGWIIKTKDKR